MTETYKNGNLVKFKAGRPMDQAIISADPAVVAKRLKLMVVGGRKLSDDEALAWAAYSIGTGLNPFLGESHYLPGVGPGPGIAGWRRKGSEQLWFEAEQARLPSATFWCEYRLATEDEANFDPQKDIAYMVTLHDTVTRTSWEQKILGHVATMQRDKVGTDSKERLDIARELAGPEPTWSAVGVVSHLEKFSASGKPEMWDRNERAKKRGEKGCIRKRFNLYIPEPLGFEVEAIEGEFLEAGEEDQGDRMTPEEIIGSLYGERVSAEVTTTEVAIDKPKPVTTKEIYQSVVDAKLSENIHSAKKALDRCTTGYDTPEKAIAWMKIYRAWRDMDDDPVSAAASTNKGEAPK